MVFTFIIEKLLTFVCFAPENSKILEPNLEFVS